MDQFNASTPILKYIRAVHQSSQDEFANTIGISRSDLAKIESGRKSIDLSSWLSFCEEYQVDPNCAISENFDYPRFPATKTRPGYLQDAYSHSRTIRLYNNYYKKEYGAHKLKELQRHIGVDPLIFVNSDQSINISYHWEILKALFKNGHFKNTTSIANFALFARSDSQHHYDFDYFYDLKRGQYQKCEELIKRIEKYEQNHSYELLEYNTSGFVLKVSVKEHIDFHALKEDSDLYGFFKIWFGEYFKNFSDIPLSYTLRDAGQSNTFGIYHFKVL